MTALSFHGGLYRIILFSSFKQAYLPVDTVITAAVSQFRRDGLLSFHGIDIGGVKRDRKLSSS